MPAGPSQATRRTVASRALPAPRFRYSPVVQAGPHVFVSGMVALDAGTGALIDGGVFEQTAKILQNLQALVREQAWSLDQMVLARVFCTDFAAFGDFNRAWEAFFADTVPPARTSVGVNALPLGALVEIEFQFVVHPAAVA